MSKIIRNAATMFVAVGMFAAASSSFASPVPSSQPMPIMKIAPVPSSQQPMPIMKYAPTVAKAE